MTFFTVPERNLILNLAAVHRRLPILVKNFSSSVGFQNYGPSAVLSDVGRALCM